ncbi:hypothetical protein [uncultured Roseobacter sp.]|uniref:hypothetical protein n=1 Tax=uncultured Roseobacter sp. TaxID=114847 RepID=UPI0026088EC1|nr:hypothetical protein [uncultured Roseobacter sp.]
MQTIVASSLLFSAGCAASTVIDKITVEDLADGRDSNAGQRLVLASSIRSTSAMLSDGMLAVSKRCGSDTLLSVDQVNLVEDSFTHYDLIGGGSINEQSYTFRCPEPGKEIQ